MEKLDSADSSSNSEEPASSQPEAIRSSSGTEESCTNPSSDSVEPDSSTSGGDPASSEQSRGSSPTEQEENLLQRKWEEMFARLEKYKEKNGDCLVPNRYRADPQLGNWGKSRRTRLSNLKGH